MTRIGKFVVFSILAVALPMFVIGCGAAGSSNNNGGNTQKTTPTITWATPAAITYGTALSATQLNATASVAGSFVYTPAAGTTPAAGSQTLSAAFTPTDTTSYNDASASVTLTVNKATPAITWPAPASIDSNTPLGGVLNATSTVAGSYSYTATPTGGIATAVTASSTLAAGSYMLTATLAPADAADYNAATMSVPLTVTQALPTTTSITPTTTYTDMPSLLGNRQLNGTNFLSTDTLKKTGACSLSSATYDSPTAITFGLDCNGANYATGYVNVGVCRAAGSPCSNLSSMVYQGPYHEGLAMGEGILYSSNGTTVQAFQVNGTSLTKLTMANSIQSGSSLIAWDNITKNIVVGGVTYDPQGNIVGMPEHNSVTNTDNDSDIVVKDKFACAPAPNTNNVEFWDITQFNSPVTAVQVGNQPISCAMADFGTTTRSEYIVSRGGSQVTLWLLQNEIPTSGSAYFTGATPVAAYPLLNASASGYPVIAFETGPAKGTIVVLDIADGLLGAFNQGVTAMLWSQKVPGAVHIAKDESNGKIIVAYANTAKTATTTTATVNALTGGNPTPLQLTSSQYPNGFVAANGFVYISQDGTPDAGQDQ